MVSMVLERTERELRGISCPSLKEVVPAKQQIMVSRSFGHHVYTEAELAASLRAYTARAAEILRKQAVRRLSIRGGIIASLFGLVALSYSGITINLVGWRHNPRKSQLKRRQHQQVFGQQHAILVGDILHRYPPKEP